MKSWSAPLSSSPNRHTVDTENAELCWSKGYGRYKYCGLRKDPFAPIEPPRYSLEPLDIKLPELDPVEKENLKKLKELTADLGDGRHRVDATTLLRFLRGREGNVMEAEQLLREAASYRQEHKLDGIWDWNLEAYEQCLAPWWLSGGFICHGLRGEPVAIERIGRCNWPKLVAALPWDVVLKVDLVHCQRAMAAVEEDALRRDVPLLPTTLIFDLEGFGFDQISFRAAHKLKKLIDSRNLLLTEATGNIIMVRTPKAFAQAWSLFKHLLQPRTVAKVKVATTEDTFKQLCEFMDEKDIPAYLGGSKCIDGDPECRRILAPGGYPPQEALERLQEIISQGKRDKRTFDGGGKFHNSAVSFNPQISGEDTNASSGRATSVCGLRREQACCVIA